MNAVPYLAAVSERLTGVMSSFELVACGGILARLHAVTPRAFVFECPLGSDTPRADFAFSIERPSVGLATLLAAAGPATPAWQAVRGMLTALDGPGPQPAVSTAWLEFDLDGRAASEPSVFVGAVDLAGPAGIAPLAALLATLAPLDDAMQAALVACHRALPPGAAVFQVGRMLPRPGAPVRVCVRDVAPDALAPYLAAIAPGRGLRLPAEVAPLVARHRPFVLDLDIERARGIGDRLGIELIVEDREPARAAELLDRLVELGLCTPARRAQVTAWVGATAYTRRDAPLPLGDAMALLGPGVRGGQLRLLSHLKLVCEHERIVAAKAYLCLRYFVTSPKGHRDAKDEHSDRVPGSP